MLGVHAEVILRREQVVERGGVGLGRVARQDLLILIFVDADQDDVGLRDLVGGPRRRRQTSDQHDGEPTPQHFLRHGSDPFGATREKGPRASARSIIPYDCFREAP